MKSPRKIHSAVTLAVLSSMLAACTTPLVYDVEKGVKQSRSETDKGMEAIKSHEPAPLVTKTPELFAAGKSFAIKNDMVPESLRRTVTINREIDSPGTLIDRISALAGYPVVVTRTLTPAGSSNASNQQNEPPINLLANPFATPAQSGPNGLPAGVNGGGSAFQPYMLTYTGSVMGLLDTLSGRFGYYWKFKDGRIVLFETETRVFEMAALPGDTVTSNQVGVDNGASGRTNSGASSTSSSTSSKQTTQVNSSLQVWANMEANLKTMLSKRGLLSVAPSSGNITVTDVPENLNRIADYLENENRALSRQVALNIKVVTVESSDTDAYGVNWQAVRSTLQGKYGVKFAANKLLSATAPTMTVDIISGNWAGSQAMVSALSEKHRISNVTNYSSVTLNNQPVPINIGMQRAYLAQIATQMDANGNATQTLTPGSVQFGTNMSVLPRILSDGTVLMQFSMDLTDMPGDFKVFGTNDNQIQLPEITNKTLLQRAALRSGETLVLAGFESNKGSSDRAGVGSADLPYLGGSLNGLKRRESMIILVQPVLLEADR